VYQELYRTCTAVALVIKSSFGGFHVDVVVVVFLSSLIFVHAFSLNSSCETTSGVNTCCNDLSRQLFLTQAD